MARPTLEDILSGAASWDADINDNFDKLTDAPFPVLVETSLSNLNTNFSAALYDACMAVVWDGTPGNPVNLYTSNGSAWVSPDVGFSGKVLDLDNAMIIEDQKSSGTGGGNSSAGVWQTRDLNTVVRNTISGASLLYELPYDNKSGTFQVGETVTGGTSSATAVIKDLNGGSSPLKVYNISGTFQDNEQITGGTSSATADVDNLTPEDTGTGLNYAHQFLLPAGEYLILFGTPGYAGTNNPVHKARLRNIDDSTTLKVGESLASVLAVTGCTTISRGQADPTLASEKILEIQHWFNAAQTNGLGLPTTSGEIEVYTTVVIYKVA